MIEKFTTLKAVAIPLDRGNIDTDAIIPARFLKTIKRTGLGSGLFHAWRFGENGSEVPEFVFNMAPYQGGKILVAGENFGCGSSREHAVWALMDFGIRVAIAPSFGDIFYNNGLKNGLLPVRLAHSEIRALMERLKSSPGSEIAVDLPSQTVTGPDGAVYGFDIGSFPKECLVNGLDEIALTLQLEEQIARYERDRKAKTPWLFLDF